MDEVLRNREALPFSLGRTRMFCESIFHPPRSKRKRIKTENSSEKNTGISYNFVDYTNQRSQGLSRNQFLSVNSDYGAQQMIKHNLYKENTIAMTDVNKVFCSQWLTDEHILMGTKCNKLLIYNVNSKKIDFIPCLKGPRYVHPMSEQCGIHALKLNPSHSLMATGAQNSNEVAIYRLPYLDPVCVGEKAHLDWIFDFCWIDDQFLVSASRDKSVALWKIDESLEQNNISPLYGYMEPLCVKKCFGADKVRALVFNPNYMEIVALSLNAKIHVWDATHFKQIMSQKLELSNENVCMTKTESCSMYAVGSKSHATLIDPRTLQSICKIDIGKSGPSVRSMSFRGDLLTIGTGYGDILFFDVKAGKCSDGSHENLELNCSKCKVFFDGSSPNNIAPENSLSPSAIYTHCYDCSGTKLFAAGGPLSTAFKGNYVSLWC